MNSDLERQHRVLTGRVTNAWSNSCGYMALFITRSLEHELFCSLKDVLGKVWRLLVEVVWLVRGW